MDKKIKHLEFIQSIITRLASNSFMLKGWAATIISALFILSAKDCNASFCFIAFVPLVSFWFLDSYYLQQERLYRKLYNKVISLTEDNINFSMTVTDDLKDKNTKIINCFKSITEIVFYLPLTIIILIIYFLIK